MNVFLYEGLAEDYIRRVSLKESTKYQITTTDLIRPLVSVSYSAAD